MSRVHPAHQQIGLHVRAELHQRGHGGPDARVDLGAHQRPHLLALADLVHVRAHQVGVVLEHLVLLLNPRGFAQAVHLHRVHHVQHVPEYAHPYRLKQRYVGRIRQVYGRHNDASARVRLHGIHRKPLS